MSRTQRYISNELTHFVGRGKSEAEQFGLLVKILQEGWITHAPHNPGISGNITINPNADLSGMYNPQCVCFCDIPTDDLFLHMQKYSHFGLAFTKNFLVNLGANPVYYVSENPQEKVTRDLNEFVNQKLYNKADEFLKAKKCVSRKKMFEEMMLKHIEYFEWFREIVMDNNKEPGVPSEYLQLSMLDSFYTRYIFSYIKPFDAFKKEDDPASYYMEREWRVIGNVRFKLEDVHRILIPEKYAKSFREKFPSYYGQVTFTA